MKEVRYMISDAAKKINVEPHVLRYWEEELGTEIPRNEMGHRYYHEEDIKMMQGVKYLKEKGFQLKSIKILLPEVDKAMQLPQRRLLELRDRLELAVSQEELRLQREKELENYSGQEQKDTDGAMVAALFPPVRASSKNRTNVNSRKTLDELEWPNFYVAAEESDKQDMPDGTETDRREGETLAEGSLTRQGGEMPVGTESRRKEGRGETDGKMGGVSDEEETVGKKGGVSEGEEADRKIGCVLDEGEADRKMDGVLDEEEADRKLGGVLDEGEVDRRMGGVLDEGETDRKSGSVSDRNESDWQSGSISVEKGSGKQNNSMPVGADLDKQSNSKGSGWTGKQLDEPINGIVPEKKELQKSGSESTPVPVSDSTERMRQFRRIMNEIITDVMRENNKELTGNISASVSKELEYHMRKQEMLQEEHFKQLDRTLREYQMGQKQAAVAKECGSRRESKFFKKNGKVRI